MITSIAFAISTTSVSATHAPTVEITPTLTTTGDMDFEIDVTNTGGDPITSVDVTLPFDVGDWVGTLMADNVAPKTLAAENTVLFAGTGIPITINDLLTLTEGTPITLGKTWKEVKLLTTGTSTAEWTTDEHNMGYYSVKLHTAYDTADYATIEVTPPLGITIADLDSITGSFWYLMETGSYRGPLLELRFTSADCEDPDGAGHVDITIDTAERESPGGNLEIDGEWHLETVSPTSHAIYFGNDPIDGTAFFSEGTLTVIATALSEYSAWTLTRVHLDLGWDESGSAADTSTVYIDDITIDVTTYPVEPTVVSETIIGIESGATAIVPAGTVIVASQTPLATPGKSTGAAIPASVTITAGANDEITLTVDGVAYGPYTIAEGNYDLTTEVVNEINTATDAGGMALTESGATASLEAENIVFTSGTTGSKSSVHVDPDSSAAATLGFGPEDEVTETPGAGTVVTLLYDTYVTLGEGTCLTKPEVILPSVNMVKLPAGTEIELIELTGVNLESATLPSDTHLVLGEVAGAMLCEDTEGEIGPSDVPGVTLISKTTCPLFADNTVLFPETTTSTIKVPKDTKVVLTISEMPIGSELELAGNTLVNLWGASTVVLDKDVPSVPIDPTAEFYLPPDYKVTATLTERKDIMLPKDTEIELPKDAKIYLKGGEEDNAKLALPIPSDWKVTKATGKEATWENATVDSAIGPGESLTFSIRATTIEDGEYLWTVTTTDAEGKTGYKTLTTTVDGTKPTILKVAMEPDMVGAGSATIKVVASEELSNLDNVYCQIDDNEDHVGDPVKLISMESADGITWTGTLTIPGNGLWDENKVDVVVLAKLTKDMASNTPEKDNDVNIHSTTNRHINTIPPLLPADLEMTGTAPFDNEVNQKSQLITGTAQDNIAGEATPQDNLTVKIRVGTTTYETKSFADGTFVREIDLAEGPNTIKVWVIDELGNASPENEQAVFLDSIKPTISMVSVAGKAYEDNVPVNDDTPTVVLTIKDSGYPDTALGIEYDNITVKLENADGADFGTLENAIPWDKVTGRFENTIPEKLDEGFYCIIVNATDVIGNTHSTTFWFKVDVTAPTIPSLNAANNPILYGTTVAEPKVQKEMKLVLYGSGLEESCEVKVYLVDQATGETISTETTAADSTGGFSESLTLVGGKTIRIKVETIDAAGNVSDGKVYGYVMADATAPAVTLEALPGTTDTTSVILSGTVTKDTWEDWSDITLTAQVGIGSVDVQIGAEGGYSCSVPLSMGVNTIVVRATDSIGNVSIPTTATVERVVTMDTSVPGVTLEALPEATDKVSVTISGTVTKDDWESWSDITLTVQVGTGKVEVPIGAGGSYSYSIGLAEGPNMIVVQATDAVGNASAAESAMIERTTTPWGTYAIVLVIIALVIAAIAIFRKKK